MSRVKLKRKRNMDLSPDRNLFITYGKQVVPNARVRARTRGLPCDIDAHTVDRLLVDQRWRCAVTGLPLESPGERGPFSPSLDRIVPERGYVEGNVRIVSNIVNFAMNKWGEEALMTMVRAIAAKS